MSSTTQGGHGKAARRSVLGFFEQDLAEFVKEVKPYTGGDEYAVPDFFAGDEEQQEFVAWVRAERDKALV